MTEKESKFSQNQPVIVRCSEEILVNPDSTDRVQLQSSETMGIYMNSSEEESKNIDGKGTDRISHPNLRPKDKEVEMRNNSAIRRL